MKRIFIGLTVAGLATMLVAVSARGGSMAFDDKGNLFVADRDSGSILKFTSDGKRSTFASRLAPENLAFDRSGNLFVTHTPSKDTRAEVQGSDSILKFTPDGKRSTLVSGLGHPGSLTFDDKGNLFVSIFVKEYSSYSILKFTPEGV